MFEAVVSDRVAQLLLELMELRKAQRDDSKRAQLAQLIEDIEDARGRFAADARYC